MDEEKDRLEPVAEQLPEGAEKLDSVAQKLATTEQELNDSKRQCQALGLSTGTLKQLLGEKELLLEQYRLELQDQQSDYKVLGDKLNDTQEELTQSELKNGKLAERIESLNREVAKQVHDSQKYLQTIEQNHQNELDQKQLELTALQENISEAQQQIQALDETIAEKNLVHTALLDEHKQALDNNAELQQENNAQHQTLEQRANQIDELQQKFDTANENISNLNIDKLSLEKQLQTAISYKEYAESEQKCAEQNTDYLSNTIEELKADAARQKGASEQALLKIQKRLQIELNKPVMIDGTQQAEFEAQIEEQRNRNSELEVANNILEGRINKLTTDLTETSQQIERAEAIATEAEESLAIALVTMDHTNSAREASGPGREDESAKLTTLRESYIKEEKAFHKAEKKGGSSLPRLFILLLILAGCAYGAAEYLEIDLENKLAPFIEKAQSSWESVKPTFESLIEMLP